MVRKTKEDAQLTHDRILKAAVDVFYEKGVARATLENIAAAAGMTRGAIYWHFKNKLDLFAALHDRVHNIYMPRLIETRNAEGAASLTQLAELSISFLLELETEEEHKKSLAVMIVKSDYSGELAPFLKVQNAQKIESLNVMTEIFKNAKALGHISADSDCDLLSLSLWCLVNGAMTEYLRDPSSFNIMMQARPLVQQFFKGIIIN